MLTNLVLGLFNLLPIPPLDGGRSWSGCCRCELAQAWARLERFGIVLVLLVVFLLPRMLRFRHRSTRSAGAAEHRGAVGVRTCCCRLAGHDADRQVGRCASRSDPSPTACASDSLLLRLEGFEGPLDLLLDLARAQKVDLAKISILALVEQYLAVIEGARRVRLELAADWLVMAAWLTWLKSRLLLPAGAEAEEARAGGGGAGGAAARLQAMRAAARLAGRPAAAWPGRVRPRRAGGPHRDRPVAAGAGPGLAGARLSAGGAARRGHGARYQPRPLSLWSVQDALRRLARLLVGSLPDWTSLERFLPETLGGPLERRAALASTLMAGLEMARGGAVRLRQEQAFGPILVRRARAG